MCLGFHLAEFLFIVLRFCSSNFDRGHRKFLKDNELSGKPYFFLFLLTSMFKMSPRVLTVKTVAIIHCIFQTRKYDGAV